MEEILNLAQNVRLVPKQVPVQTIIVNNEERHVMGEAFAMCCPKCGRILQTFQPGVDIRSATLAIKESKDKLTNAFAYCVGCGQKLAYDLDVFDGGSANE